MKRLSTEDFIRKSKLVHGEKYDYSKTVYVNAYTDVIITCPIHGDFLQKPHEHLKGCGCNICARHGKLVFGKGIIDVAYPIKGLQVTTTWKNMLKRCYDESARDKFPTYQNCVVCDAWLKFSNFKRWYDKNHINGYHLDKDILIKGNKIYSPNTCCFVPQEINKLFTKTDKFRGNTPIGVQKVGDRFYSRLKIRKHLVSLGYYKTAEDAFIRYKAAKENYIKEIANEYKEKRLISDIVYNALMRYEVSIND